MVISRNHLLRMLADRSFHGLDMPKEQLTGLESKYLCFMCSFLFNFFRPGHGLTASLYLDFNARSYCVPMPHGSTSQTRENGRGRERVKEQCHYLDDPLPVLRASRYNHSRQLSRLSRYGNVLWSISLLNWLTRSFLLLTSLEVY